jgi:hypothetical protein
MGGSDWQPLVGQLSRLVARGEGGAGHGCIEWGGRGGEGEREVVEFLISELASESFKLNA